MSVNDRGQLGRLLLVGMGQRGGAAVAPPRSAEEWLRLIQLADRHLVLPAFERALARLDMRPGVAELAEALTTVAQANAERNEMLRAQLIAVGRSLNEAGFEPCLLKGAIRLVDDLYPDPAWRYMSDLDILLPEEQVNAAWQHLAGLGYRQKDIGTSSPRHDHHHLPALRHPDFPAWIEVHEALHHSRGDRLLPADEVWSASSAIEFDGARFRVPSNDHQLAHAVGHQFLQHGSHWSGTLRLRDLFEVYCLAARADCDVTACRKRFASIGCESDFSACLLLVDEVFGSAWEAKPSGYARLLARVASTEHEKASTQMIRWYCHSCFRGIGHLFVQPRRFLNRITSRSFYVRRFDEFRRLYGAIGR